MTRPRRAFLTAFTLLAGAGAVAAAAATTTAQNSTATNATQEEDGLHSLMVKAGKMYFGTATDVGTFNDTRYQAIISNKNMFGMITADNSMKWAAIQKSPDKYSYADADQVVAKAKANGQQMRCHTLVYTQLPSFGNYPPLTWLCDCHILLLRSVPCQTNKCLPTLVEKGSWKNETLIAAMQTYIMNVVQHFKGTCYAWDVVIEALGDTPDEHWRDTIWSRNIGPAFIPIAFAAAAKADPDAKLYYSDYNLEFFPDKAAAVVDIVADLQARKIKIDGVGFEGHLIVGATPSRLDIATALTLFTDMGLEVAFTELDIRHNSLPASDAEVQKQADGYVAVVGACLDVPGCVGVTVWEFTDKYSWIPDALPNQGNALLWTADYKPKPAYDAVMALLRAAASNSTGANGTTAGEGKSGVGRGAVGSVLGSLLGAGLLSVWLLL